MGFFSSLFGGTKTVSLPPPQITRVSTLDPQQRQLFDSLTSNLQSQPFQATPFEPSSGRLSPGLSNLQNTSLAGLEELALQQVGAGGAADVVSNAQGAFNEILTSGPQAIDDFFTTNVQEPLVESFTEDILPDISRRLARNFFGSERRDIERDATEELISVLGRERSSLAFNARESDLNRRASVLPLTGDLSTNLLGQLAGLGDIPRVVEQQQTQAELGEVNRQNEENQRLISNLLAAIGVPTEQIIGSPSAQVVQQPGILGGLLSGIGSIATGFNLGGA